MAAWSTSGRDDRPFITLRDVTVRLGERLGFEHTTWRMTARQQWAVVGANGSGKSVLMKAICGELPIVDGEIIYHFAGRGGAGAMSSGDILPEQAIRYVSVETHRRLVRSAMAYHQARWSPIEQGPVPTALDVLLEDSPSNSPRTYRHVVELLGIERVLDRSVSHLSNGETRKLLIARAILALPRLLILDDPFAGLDHGSRRTLRKGLSALMRGGTHVLVVTQRVDELPAGTTHLLYVEDHRVVAMGRKRAMLNQGVASRLDRAARSLVPRARLAPRRSRRRPPSRSTPLVEIHHARVVYGGVRILDDVSWTVRSGQHWALLGPNGAGKSTLLSLILGDNPQAYANDVSVFGRRRGPGQGLWEIRQRIGWLSPELQFHYPGEVTCEQVVGSGHFHSVGLFQTCTRGQRQAVGRWLRDLGLGELADRPFGLLSDGQQRITLLARAMVKSPPLVILDEPCQGLDTAHRRAVLSVVDRIGRRGDCCLIYVTHHAGEMPRCLTHELRLRNGRVTRCAARKT